jgi:GT2 family glycosyltransferase
MITTILQLYKRPDYLEEQLAAIKNQTLKSGEIIVVHNEGGVEFDYPENVQVVYVKPNMKFHIRFAVALLAKGDYISFLDDDTIIQKRWHENCIETIKKHDCLCVTNGRLFYPPDRWLAPGWGNPNEDEVKVDFGGHAWFLRRENLKYMWYDSVKEHQNGEDIMLSANLQIFGNIPTYVPPHPINKLELWGSHPDKARKYGSDSVASWIINKTHYEERFKLIEYYKKQGWRLQNE